MLGRHLSCVLLLGVSHALLSASSLCSLPWAWGSWQMRMLPVLSNQTPMHWQSLKSGGGGGREKPRPQGRQSPN